MTTTTDMGKIIKFPSRPTKVDKIVDELDLLGTEIELCLADIDDLNTHLLELTAGYEELVARLSNELGTTVEELLEKMKNDSER
jgi:hypothetical protein|tara:strand:- start:212 stop:463 length:252 start_codon:yes stop_codon:yes gene_type:complete